MSLLNSTLFKVYADSEKENQDESLSSNEYSKREIEAPVSIPSGKPLSSEVVESRENKTFTDDTMREDKPQHHCERIVRVPLAPTNLTRGISLVDPDFDWTHQGPCGPVFLEKNDLSLESMFKRQRAVEGVCGKKHEPSEQRINMMSLSTTEKVRSFQKTKTGDSEEKNSVQKTPHRETPEFDFWLRSPDITAEAQLRRVDEDGLIKTPTAEKPRKPGASIQWKAKKQSVDLLHDCDAMNDSHPFSKSETKNSDDDFETNDYSVPDFSMSNFSDLNLSLSNLVRENIPVEDTVSYDAAAPSVPTSGGATSDAFTPDLSQQNLAQPDSPQQSLSQWKIPRTDFASQDSKVSNQTISENQQDEEKFSGETFRLHFPSISSREPLTPHYTRRREKSWQESIRALTPHIVSVSWPEHCEKMRREADSPITALADYLEQQIDRGLERLSFCGNRPGSGCSTILLCCARELALRGRKTLMIDGHLQRPGLDRMLGIGDCNVIPQCGWESLFVPRNEDSENFRDENFENENYGDTILCSLEENLDLLPLNSQTQNSMFADILEKVQPDWCCVLQERYEIILIDSGSFHEFQETDLQRKSDEFHMFGVKKYFMILGGEPTLQNDFQNLDAFMRRQGIARIGVAENYS